MKRQEDSSVTEIPLNQVLAGFHPKCVADIKIAGVRETREDPHGPADQLTLNPEANISNHSGRERHRLPVPYRWRTEPIQNLPSLGTCRYSEVKACRSL